MAILDHAVRHDSAQQRLDCAQHGNREGRHHEIAQLVQAQGRRLERGQCLRDAAEAAADRFHGEIEQRDGHRTRDEYQHRPRHARGPALWPCKQGGEGGHAQRHGRPLHRVEVFGQGADLREKFGGQRPGLQAEKILDLRQEDQHRDAVGEADDDGQRNELDQHAQPEDAHRQQDAAGHEGADEQVRHAVLRDDAVDDDDEGAGRAADLHARAAERGDDEAGDDGREDAGFRRDTGGDGKRHRERQRDDADGDAGHRVGGERRAVVVLEAVEEPGPELRGARRLHHRITSRACRVARRRRGS